MLATKVVCPHCSKRLKTTHPLAVGKRVLCSGCGRSFPVRPDGATPLPVHRESAHGPTPEAHNPTEPAVTLHPEDAVGPRRSGGLIVAVVGGLLLLMGAAVAGVVVLGDKKAPQKPADETPADVAKTTPAASITPTSDPAPAATPRPDKASPLTPRRPGPEPTSPPLDAPSPLPTPDTPFEAGWLAPAEQAKVNKAIDQGVAYLKKIRPPKSGTWQRGAHAAGLAALPGLTLLECGVSPNDPAVVEAAAFVRQSMPRLRQTYDISLAILFLDRLGDRRDQSRIQTLALRLLAGQSDTGGWTYTCPILKPKEELALLTVLRERRPNDALDLFVPAQDERTPPQPITSAPNGISKATDPPSNLFVPQSKDQPQQPRPPARRPSQLSPAGRQAFLALSPQLKQVPALQPPRGAKAFPAGDRGRMTDNSNTQFAILGLWAARRHDVPLERALALIVTRFRTSQDRSSGGWNYHYRKGGNGSTPSMTDSGLLGMAVGLGLGTPASVKRLRKDNVDNPIIQKALLEVGKHIGTPLKAVRLPKKQRGRRPPRAIRQPINLYFLWSLERVAVLFNLKTIAKKDWYGWGVEELLAHQEKDGHWQAGGYPGASSVLDTCLALLFLKRSNLTKDLSQKLEFFVEGKGVPAERK